MGSAMLPIPKVPSSRAPNFGVLLYFCPHPLTENDKIWHDNTYGRGVLLGGQSCHCICTDASRGLSAIAEFLVKKYSPTVS